MDNQKEIKINLKQGDKVRIDNPLSHKRKGEIARVKWNPSDDYYVTVIFNDGHSGKYQQKHITKIRGKI